MAYSSISAAVGDVSFPIGKNDLIDQIGAREIELPAGQTVSMRELLNACSMDNYQTPEDVTSCPEIVSQLQAKGL